MTKTFKEVFPTLKLDKDMENLLENADVTRISVNHARDFYKIYVKAKRLIFQKNIWKLEESIKKQIFKSKDITVKIIESYECLRSTHRRLFLMSILTVFLTK